MYLLANIIEAVCMVLQTVLDLYFYVVIIACVMTWFHPDPYNTIVRTIKALTEPVFYFVRKYLPFTYTNGLDFSPIVVLIAIKLVNMVIVKTLFQFAANLS
ncbi:MAG: YggT family protein [Desulfovibrionaceae bacterium]|nr:YggT family protein [Desulfovibrionaceae bacterium]